MSRFCCAQLNVRRNPGEVASGIFITLLKGMDILEGSREVR